MTEGFAPELGLRQGTLDHRHGNPGMAAVRVDLQRLHFEMQLARPAVLPRPVLTFRGRKWRKSHAKVV